MEPWLDTESRKKRLDSSGRGIAESALHVEPQCRLQAVEIDHILRKVVAEELIAEIVPREYLVQQPA